MKRETGSKEQNTQHTQCKAHTITATKTNNKLEKRTFPALLSTPIEKLGGTHGLLIVGDGTFYTQTHSETHNTKITERNERANETKTHTYL